MSGRIREYNGRSKKPQWSAAPPTQHTHTHYCLCSRMLWLGAAIAGLSESARCNSICCWRLPPQGTAHLPCCWHCTAWSYQLQRLVTGTAVQWPLALEYSFSLLMNGACACIYAGMPCHINANRPGLVANKQLVVSIRPFQINYVILVSSGWSDSFA